MGYYIYHGKLSLERPLDSWGIGLDRTHFSDSDMRLFEKHFQKVISRQHVDSIILCNSENELQSEKQRLNQNNGIFLKEDNKAIERYVKHKKYDLLEKEQTLLYDNRTIIDFYRQVVVDGFYLKEIFEHPFKDCAGEFYSRYSPGIYYSELTVFKEACDLQFDEYRFDNYEDFENCKRTFVEYLVNQYTYGSSLLYYL